MFLTYRLGYEIGQRALGLGGRNHGHVDHLCEARSLHHGCVWEMGNVHPDEESGVHQKHGQVDGHHQIAMMLREEYGPTKAYLVYIEL